MSREMTMAVRDRSTVRGDAFAGGLKADGRAGTLTDDRGQPVVACPADLLSSLQQTLDHECGPAAEAVLRAIGRRFGELLADRVGRDLADHHVAPLLELPTAVVQAGIASAMAGWGWGRVEWDWQRHDRGLLIVTVMNGPATIGSDPLPPTGDRLLCGALAGLWSRLAGEWLDCLQTEIEAPGVSPARFIVGLSERLARAPEAGWRGQPHDRIVALLETMEV